MPSGKPRIATYTSEEIIKKFRIVAAYKGKSMSDYLSQLVHMAIVEFELEHGVIEIDEGIL